MGLPKYLSDDHVERLVAEGIAEPLTKDHYFTEIEGRLYANNGSHNCIAENFRKEVKQWGIETKDTGSLVFKYLFLKWGSSTTPK